MKHHVSVGIRKNVLQFFNVFRPIESNYGITFVNSNEYDVRIIGHKLFRKAETILMSVSDPPSYFLIL